MWLRVIVLEQQSHRVSQHPCESPLETSGFDLLNIVFLSDEGAMKLAEGLRNNATLFRLAMASCVSITSSNSFLTAPRTSQSNTSPPSQQGLKTRGATAILEALTPHPKLMTLHLGQSYASKDLNTRYNWLTDAVSPSLHHFLRSCSSLRMLDLGLSALIPSHISSLIDTVASTPQVAPSLVSLNLGSIYGKVSRDTKDQLSAMLEQNVRWLYPEVGSMEEFTAEKRRWLISSEDVRFIDSSYRNRDAGLARRGKMELKKTWGAGDEWERFEKGVMTHET